MPQFGRIFFQDVAGEFQLIELARLSLGVAPHGLSMVRPALCALQSDSTDILDQVDGLARRPQTDVDFRANRDEGNVFVQSFRDEVVALVPAVEAHLLTQ